MSDFTTIVMCPFFQELIQEMHHWVGFKKRI